jgi:hypothetical protein
MRRRRQKLQVSTFPFLAVLLCAMGSLILLLLVLDRRAKVVARAKERERQQAVLAQLSKADQDRMREYERKRDELRKRLQAEESALHTKVDSLTTEVRKKKLETLEERSRTAELKARLSALREVLAREQDGFEQEKQQSSSLSAKKRTALTENEALARELVNLERALADVIAFRKRQAQTYSLVPFLGKSGENRRPIYVECQADQIIVHPEQLIAKVASWDGTSPADALAEKLGARLKANSQETKQKPYILFLIRPEGIGTYYRVLGALGIQNIDSGYELIDSDWALDFGESGGHVPGQPWVADPRTPAPRTLTGTLPVSPRLTAPARGVPQNGVESSGEGAANNAITAARPHFGVAPADGAKGQAVNGYGSGGFGQRGGAGPTGMAEGSGVSGGQQFGSALPPFGVGAARQGVGAATNGPVLGNASGYSRAGIAGGTNGGIPGTGAGGPVGSDQPAGSGTGPSSLSELLQAQNSPSRGPALNRNPTASNAGNASSPSVPGAGVPLPGPATNSGATRGNTGDSTIAFTEPKQNGGGGLAGDPKLLPLPGANDALGTGTPAQLAGASRGEQAGAAGTGVPGDGSNTGPGGFGPGNGMAQGVVGGSVGSGGVSGKSMELANLGADGDPTAPPPSPLRERAGQSGGATTGDASVGGSPGTSGSSPPEAGGAGQLAGSLSVDLDPGAAKRARVDNAEGAVNSSPGGSTAGGSVQGQASGDASGESTGGNSTPGPPDPLANLAPRTRRAPAPAAFRMEGNRDLVITIECRADDVVMTANNRRWQVADLERDPAARVAFALAVQDWISRRQATVREGQTPYRPQIRFRVNPDGLRTYYAAYPALEKLGFPMKRDNVDGRPPPTPHIRPE